MRSGVLGTSTSPIPASVNRNGTISPFQTSLCSLCSILMAVYLSAGSKETVGRLLALDVGVGELHLV